MSDDNLTFVQRCALVILMVEAREVPNTDLKNVRGLDLKKEYRDPLTKDGLIKVRQQRKGGPLSLELTDKGWRRAIAELGGDLPARAGSGGAALYAVLETVRHFLDRSNMTAQEFFVAPDDVQDPTPPDIEARIRKAYGELAPRAGAWVMLAKLRAALGQVPREDVDATLVRLNQAPDVRLIPESNQKVLTADERAAAVSIGNQDKHLIAIGS